MVQPFATMVIGCSGMKATLGLSYGWILVIVGIAVHLLGAQPARNEQLHADAAHQPELQPCRRSTRATPAKLQAEMMKLYRARKSPFSSLSGCLPMLIPLRDLPSRASSSSRTRSSSAACRFIWLPDISIKDPLYVLPVLVAVTAMLLSYIDARHEVERPAEEMMYMMPAMMLFIFLNMASGLNLYYLVQNLASLPQQWLISQERGRQTPLVQGPVKA